MDHAVRVLRCFILTTIRWGYGVRIAVGALSRGVFAFALALTSALAFPQAAFTRSGVSLCTLGHLSPRLLTVPRSPPPVGRYPVHPLPQ